MIGDSWIQFLGCMAVALALFVLFAIAGIWEDKKR